MRSCFDCSNAAKEGVAPEAAAPRPRREGLVLRVIVAEERLQKHVVRAEQSARRNFGRCKNTFFASCLFHADWNCRSAIVFHHTQHCMLKVGKFSRACPCRAFLQSLLSCLVHPYLLRNLFQLLFYSFRQVRFWAWIGATKMDPLGGAPSVYRFCLLPSKSCTFAPRKIWQCTGKCSQIC